MSTGYIGCCGSVSKLYTHKSLQPSKDTFTERNSENQTFEELKVLEVKARISRFGGAETKTNISHKAKESPKHNKMSNLHDLCTQYKGANLASHLQFYTQAVYPNFSNLCFSSSFIPYSLPLYTQCSMVIQSCKLINLRNR